MGFIPSYDMDLKTCQDSCNYGKSLIGYCQNNMQYKRNTKLIKTKSFVDELNKEIKRINCHKIRFFGTSGDLTDLNDLLKICYLAELNPNNKFWLPTHRMDIPIKYIDLGFKIPNNITIRISNPLINLPMPQSIIDICLKYGFTYSRTSLNKSLVNCKSSMNKKSCLDNNCSKCFDKDTKEIVYFLHGKLAKPRLKKWNKRKNV